MAKCPSHPDRQASLHVCLNDRGIGLKCHAGCGTEEILQELDLPWDALFLDEPQQRAQPIEYNYKDAEGRLLYQVLRYEDKQFRQRVPNGSTWTWSLNGVKRVPYMLPNIIESSSDDPIFVVEGEKDVHTLNARGILATTNSGGAKWNWPEEWRVYFEGRKVVLIPDTDEPGMAHMNQIGELLAPIADVFIIHLRGAKDITDWFLAHPDPELKEFNQLVEEARPFGEKRPSLSFSEPPPPFTYSDAPVWDGLLGAITKVVDPYSEHDPVAFFMELMTMFGVSLNRNPHYLLGKTPHYTNLFTCIVGDTAEGRKGTAHGYAKDIYRRVDPDFVQKRMPASLASGEGLVNMVRDGKTKEKGEQVVVLDEGVTDKRLLVIDEEFAARTLVAMNREGSSLAGVLRSCWDGPDTLDVPTKMNSIHATNPHVGFIGHATPLELMATLRPEHVAGGSANRFLWFMVNRSKEINTVDVDPPERELMPLVNKLMRAKDFAIKRQRMFVSDDAHAVFQEIRKEYESRRDGDTGQQRHFVGRGMPQVMRMAMILALVEMEEVIQTPHLEQAYGLFNFSRKSVEYILDTEQLVLNTDEQKLFYMLEIEGSMTQGEIKEKLAWNGAKAARVSASLCSKKLAHEYREPAKGGRGGKPRRVLAV